MSSPTRILDLEHKLADDNDGTYRDSLCESLRSEQQGIKRHMDSGLPPEEFQQASDYANALEAAVNVVEHTWKVDHPDS